MIRVGRGHSVIAILLALIAALVLAFGHRVGFSDVIKSGISGFVFALIPVLLYMGYDRAKSKQEQRERRRAAFKGIYLELIEFLEYFEDLYQDDKSSACGGKSMSIFYPLPIIPCIIA